MDIKKKTLMLLGAAAVLLGAKGGASPSTSAPPTTVKDAVVKALTTNSTNVSTGSALGGSAGWGVAYGTPGAMTGVATVDSAGNVRVSNAATDGRTIVPIGINEVGIGTSAAVSTALGSTYTQFSQRGFDDVGTRFTSRSQLTQYQSQVRGEVSSTGTRTSTITAGGAGTSGITVTGSAGATATRIQAAVAAGNWSEVTSIQKAAGLI